MTDTALEALIDEAGRDAVFARARAYGYNPYSMVEKYVWYQIAHEVKNKVPLPVPPPRLDEAVLGFRLF